MNNQQFSSTPPTPTPPSIVPSLTPQPAIVFLPKAGQLLKEAFKIYKSRFWVFLGIVIIPFFISLLFLGLAIILRFLGASWIWSVLLLIVFLILIVINLWAGVSLLYAIKEREQKIGIKESFAKGWHKIISYLWISIIVGLITMGGFILFTVPGIIFAAWFSLASYILVSEDIKGMNALFRSKQLIKGYWGRVFWRFLVMGIVSAVIVVPIAFLAEIFNIPLIINILSALITPLYITFGFLIYENLKLIKREVAFEPPKRGTKIGFILIGIIGILLIPAVSVWIILGSSRWARTKAKDIGTIAEMSAMRATVELYAMENNDSYLGFSCNSSQETAKSCDYINKQLGEKPVIHASKDSYCIYVKLRSNEHYCVDSDWTTRRTNIYPGGTGYCNGLTFVCP